MKNSLLVISAVLLTSAGAIAGFVPTEANSFLEVQDKFRKAQPIKSLLELKQLAHIPLECTRIDTSMKSTFVKNALIFSSEAYAPRGPSTLASQFHWGLKKSVTWSSEPNNTSREMKGLNVYTDFYNINEFALRKESPSQMIIEVLPFGMISENNGYSNIAFPGYNGSPSSYVFCEPSSSQQLPALFPVNSMNSIQTALVGNKCLDLVKDSKGNDILQTWDCDIKRNQRFEYFHKNYDAVLGYTSTIKIGNLCLAAKKNQKDLIVEKCNGSALQRWEIPWGINRLALAGTVEYNEQTGETTDGRCLSVTEKEAINGTKVNLSKCKGAYKDQLQKWIY